MLRIGAIVLQVSDTPRAAAFWSQALGYHPDSNPDFLVPTKRGAPRLHLDTEDRTHIDLWAADEREQRGEVERLLQLGATRAAWDYPENADFVVLIDPDGTLFCVINTSAGSRFSGVDRRRLIENLARCSFSSPVGPARYPVPITDRRPGNTAAVAGDCGLVNVLLIGKASGL